MQTGQISEEAKEQVDALLKQQFRPEFLNRLDEIVFYKPLTRDEIGHIVDLQMVDLQRRLADKQLGVKLTPEAKTFIVDSGYDPVYGARPLKRFLQSKVETLIAKKIIQGNIKPRETLLVDYDGKQLVVKDQGGHRSSLKNGCSAMCIAHCAVSFCLSA